jgi:glyoxylase-like metal-dependent hydrolase (beta-lactamase superfamily II)
MNASRTGLPKSMQVFERGWLSSNNILFLGRHATALVDSGYASHADLTEALVSRGLQGRPLDQLINTHLHSDHCGGNARLQSVWNPRTLIPEADAASIREWRASELNASQTGQHLERFSFDATLRAGDSLELADMAWQVLAAPGHDPHSLILFCANQGILISADALWEQGFGVIFPELVGEEGFIATRTTLESIKALGARIVIPGHGAPFTDVDGALERAFARLDYLSANPLRNARHAVKVLLKFLLLERQVMTLDEVDKSLASIQLVNAINQRHLHLEPKELRDWAVAELLRLDAARLEGQQLVNVG